MQNLDVAFNQESYDDGESEWNNNAIDLFDLASAAGRLAGNLNNKPGALDDFFNKLKVLEHEWYEAEKRYNKLRMENDVLNNQLMHETTKCVVYQKKLKFIQDNQKNFEKLKEVYLAMKQQECKSLTLGNICEQACQTIDFSTGKFESKAVATTSIFTCDQECLTKYHGNAIQSDSMIAIRRSELTDAHENLQLLKDMIKKREYTWSVNVQREESMKEQIRTLEEEKQSLETLVRMKDVELKAMKNMKSQNPVEQQDNVNNMKRIIGKLSQRLRELEKLERSGRLQRILDDKEEKVVKEIESGDFVPRRPSLKTQATRTGVSRNVQGNSSKIKINKGQLSPIIETKSKPNSQSSDDYEHEEYELEVLGQIKKTIEMKQAALKEKVQQIINCTGAQKA
ncbi:hypothetical protein Trydic_g22368 [Trypoxylus dichotomus]